MFFHIISSSQKNDAPKEEHMSEIVSSEPFIKNAKAVGGVVHLQFTSYYDTYI